MTATRTAFVKMPSNWRGKLKPGRYVWRKDWIAVDRAQPLHAKHGNGAMVIPDLEPYQSMVDGSMITGRRQHRDHLRLHGKIEMGNEMPKMTKPLDAKAVRAGVRESLKETAQRLNDPSYANYQRDLTVREYHEQAKVTRESGLG